MFADQCKLSSFSLETKIYLLSIKTLTVLHSVLRQWNIPALVSELTFFNVWFVSIYFLALKLTFLVYILWQRALLVDDDRYHFRKCASERILDLMAHAVLSCSCVAKQIWGQMALRFVGRGISWVSLSFWWAPCCWCVASSSTGERVTDLFKKMQVCHSRPVRGKDYLQGGL